MDKQLPTVACMLRVPVPLDTWVRNYAQKSGFRSVQELMLELLRERKDRETAARQQRTIEAATDRA
jgi:hypothetical protein